MCELKLRLFFIETLQLRQPALLFALNFVAVLALDVGFQLKLQLIVVLDDC